MIGAVTAPTAVLIRPDGYVAWVGDLTQVGLADDARHVVRTAYRGLAHRLPRSTCTNIVRSVIRSDDFGARRSLRTSSEW